ncbi:MAG: glycerophosphodiester phosphodiesterase [Pseudomonadota bacterium]
MDRVSASKEDIARRRNRNWVLVFVVCLFIGGIRAVSLKPPLAGAFSVTDSAAAGTWVIAHRGGGGLRPENTMLAFQHAAELGVDMLTLDVRLTADGVAVVLHDATVDRTTDGTGRLADLPLAQVRRLDAAALWADYAGRGVRVPTLLAVLDRFAEQRVAIEIQDDDLRAAEIVCATLEQSGLGSRALVGSPHRKVLLEFRRRCPEVATSASTREAFWFVVYHYIGLGRWYESGNQVLRLPVASRYYDSTQPGLFQSAARTGRGIHLDAVNEPALLEQVMHAGAAGVITDFPDRALELRAGLTESAGDGVRERSAALGSEPVVRQSPGLSRRASEETMND